MPFRYIFHSFQRLFPAFMVFYQTLEILYFPDTRPSQLSSILITEAAVAAGLRLKNILLSGRFI